VTEPDVTILVIPRERFSAGLQSLEALYKHSSIPFKLVYIDGNSPKIIAQKLREESVQKGFELIRSNLYLTPNQARNLGMERVTTKYVVFIDNDVSPDPNWLEHMVACAEQTTAAIVVPLVLEGWRDDPIVHLAGGLAHFEEKDGKRRFIDQHNLHPSKYEEVRATLQREPTELFEFHGCLMRSAVVFELGPFDPELVSLFEHVDFSLICRNAGYAIFFEPEAVVFYPYFSSFEWNEFQNFYIRWNDCWATRSIRHFAKKWNLCLDDPYFYWTRRFVRGHRRFARLHLKIAKQLLGSRLGDIAEIALLRAFYEIVNLGCSLRSPTVRGLIP
jgi:GT2 family glycosyltransferase